MVKHTTAPIERPTSTHVLDPVRDSNARLVLGKIFGIARYEDQILDSRRRKDDRIGNAHLRRASQRHRLVGNVPGQFDTLETREKLSGLGLLNCGSPRNSKLYSTP